jgi:hypothetical protein
VNPYTVILVRPDYMACNYGTDTYTAHVEAATPHDAAQAAKNECWTIDNSYGGVMDAEPTGEPKDYHCVAVFDGHLTAAYGE